MLLSIMLRRTMLIAECDMLKEWQIVQDDRKLYQSMAGNGRSKCHDNSCFM